MQIWTFSREVTFEKMKITSTQRADSLKLLEKLSYAVDEEDYSKIYEDFVQGAPESVANYFNNNWHGIKKEWVIGLKSYPCLKSSIGEGQYNTMGATGPKPYF